MLWTYWSCLQNSKFPAIIISWLLTGTVFTSRNVAITKASIWHECDICPGRPACESPEAPCCQMLQTRHNEILCVVCDLCYWKHCHSKTNWTAPSPLWTVAIKSSSAPALDAVNHKTWSKRCWGLTQVTWNKLNMTPVRERTAWKSSINNAEWWSEKLSFLSINVHTKKWVIFRC